MIAASIFNTVNEVIKDHIRIELVKSDFFFLLSCIVHSKDFEVFDSLHCIAATQ